MTFVIQTQSIVLLIILFSISVISYFQGYKVTADRIFMSLIYCSLLITLYFTYLVVVAKKMLKRQIEAIVKDILEIQTYFNIKPQKIKETQSQKENNISTKEKNKIIFHKSLKIIGVTLCLSFLLSSCIWIYKNRHHKKYAMKNYLKEIIFKNIMLLFCVVLVQLFFSTVFIGYVLPLDSKNVIHIILNKILDDDNKKIEIS